MTPPRNRRLAAVLFAASLLGAVAWSLLTMIQVQQGHGTAPSVQAAGDAVPFVKLPELSSLLRSGRWTFVEFGGRTCIPCQQMQPILKRLIAEHGDALEIVNLYLEDDPPAVPRFGIQLMPTQILFDGSGKEVLRHLGLWGEEELRKALADLGVIP